MNRWRSTRCWKDSNQDSHASSRPQAVARERSYLDGWDASPTDLVDE